MTTTDSSVYAPARPARQKPTSPEPIGDALKAVIRERHLTAYALGKMSGVSPSIVSRWLCGNRTLNLRTVEKLATALHLELRLRAQETS